MQKVSWTGVLRLMPVAAAIFLSVAIDAASVKVSGVAGNPIVGPANLPSLFLALWESAAVAVLIAALRLLLKKPVRWISECLVSLVVPLWVVWQEVPFFTSSSAGEIPLPPWAGLVAGFALGAVLVWAFLIMGRRELLHQWALFLWPIAALTLLEISIGLSPMAFSPLTRPDVIGLEEGKSIDRGSDIPGDTGRGSLTGRLRQNRSLVIIEKVLSRTGRDLWKVFRPMESLRPGDKRTRNSESRYDRLPSESPAPSPAR